MLRREFAYCSFGMRIDWAFSVVLHKVIVGTCKFVHFLCIHTNAEQRIPLVVIVRCIFLSNVERTCCQNYARSLLPIPFTRYTHSHSCVSLMIEGWWLMVLRLQVASSDPAEVKSFIRSHATNFVTSELPLGTAIKRYFPAFPIDLNSIYSNYLNVQRPSLKRWLPMRICWTWVRLDSFFCFLPCLIRKHEFTSGTARTAVFKFLSDALKKSWLFEICRPFKMFCRKNIISSYSTYMALSATDSI